MASKTTTSTNLSPNVASALCYVPVVGWIAAIVLFIIEKDSTVRWNAVQSIILGLVLAVLPWVLGATIILLALAPFVFVAGVILNLILAVKAYQGTTWKLPVLGSWADKIVKKV